MLINDDCLSALKDIETNSIDSLVTDPPAGISFMDNEWDKDKGGRDSWIKWFTEIMCEVHRVLKPGAHGFVWAIPRTSHWIGLALENADFQIRDIVTHVFGSGFPKSHNISKGIDKKAGKVKVTGKMPDRWTGKGNTLNFSTDRPQSEVNITTPNTDLAKQWDGWGTALKP